jgi:hypothetical protein
MGTKNLKIVEDQPMNGQYTDKLKVCMYKVLVFQLLIANYFEITFKVTWTLAM